MNTTIHFHGRHDLYHKHRRFPPRHSHHRHHHHHHHRDRRYQSRDRPNDRNSNQYQSGHNHKSEIYGLLFQKKYQSVIVNIMDELDSITFIKIYEKLKTNDEYDTIYKYFKGNENILKKSLNKLLMHFINSKILAENQQLKINQNMPLQTGCKYEKNKNKWNNRFGRPTIPKTDNIKQEQIIKIDIDENNNNNNNNNPKSMAYFCHSKRMFICLHVRQI